MCVSHQEILHTAKHDAQLLHWVDVQKGSVKDLMKVPTFETMFEKVDDNEEGDGKDAEDDGSEKQETSYEEEEVAENDSPVVDGVVMKKNGVADKGTEKHPKTSLYLGLYFHGEEIRSAGMKVEHVKTLKALKKAAEGNS